MMALALGLSLQCEPVAAGRPVCQFPPLQAWGMRSLQWYPVAVFDWLMVGYAKNSPHLKY